MRAPPLPLVALPLLVACAGDAPEPEPVLRTVRTVVATPVEPVRERRFPTVLEPAEITELAFDVGGRLGPLDLRLGQRVGAGDVLATVETTDADLRLRQSRASVREAESAAEVAARDAERQARLFETRTVAEAERDRAADAAERAAARLEQARRGLELLEESLADTTLRAPFDGVIDSIGVRAFGSVRAGEPVLTLYPDERLQATVLVSYAVASELALGRTVSVLPSDGPDEPLAATVTEIARRAPAVASFPVVVTLDETREDLRSGMAAEVLVTLPLADGETGIPIPIGALALQRPAELGALPRRADVFVYREDGTGGARVEPRTVALAAAVGERVLVVDGLEPGERVVTAGVPFLHPGQAVAPIASDGPATGTTGTTGASGASGAAGAAAAEGDGEGAR